MEDEKIVRAAFALIYKGGTILGVSRKDDSTQMGLPGGKVEEGETFEEAVIRETKEETGLDIVIDHHVFDRMDENFIGKTFYCRLADPDADIQTTESGIARWITWEELFDGPFGEYNKNLHTHLTTKFKPKPNYYKTERATFIDLADDKRASGSRFDELAYTNLLKAWFCVIECTGGAGYAQKNGDRIEEEILYHIEQGLDLMKIQRGKE